MSIFLSLFYTSVLCGKCLRSNLLESGELLCDESMINAKSELRHGGFSSVDQENDKILFLLKENNKFINISVLAIIHYNCNTYHSSVHCILVHKHIAL